MIDLVHDREPGLQIEQAHGQAGFDPRFEVGPVVLDLGPCKDLLVVLRLGCLRDTDPLFAGKGEKRFKGLVVDVEVSDKGFALLAPLGTERLAVAVEPGPYEDVIEVFGKDVSEKGRGGVPLDDKVRQDATATDDRAACIGGVFERVGHPVEDFLHAQHGGLIA